MRRSLVAAALTASSLLLASCAMPADDPNWNAEEAEAVEFAEDDAEAAAEEADAVASLDTALANPTSIGVDAPLTAAPDSGLVIVSLSDRIARGELRLGSSDLLDGPAQGFRRLRHAGRDQGIGFAAIAEADDHQA